MSSCRDCWQVSVAMEKLSLLVVAHVALTAAFVMTAHLTSATDHWSVVVTELWRQPLTSSRRRRRRRYPATRNCRRLTSTGLTSALEHQQSATTRESGATTRRGCGVSETTTRSGNGVRSRRDCGANGWTWMTWPDCFKTTPSRSKNEPPSCRTRGNGPRTKPECGESNPIPTSEMQLKTDWAQLISRLITLFVYAYF